MRALLFTALAVVVATASGIGFLALSPAPDRPSDSLTLVIETGSIPTRSASANKTDSSLEQAGNETAPAGGKAKSQSLDEVIAARLREAGERRRARSSHHDPRLTTRRPLRARIHPIRSATEQAQQPSTASVPGASVTFDGPPQLVGSRAVWARPAASGWPSRATDAVACTSWRQRQGTVSSPRCWLQSSIRTTTSSAAQQASGDQANASGARSGDTPQATRRLLIRRATTRPEHCRHAGNDETSRETAVTNRHDDCRA